MKKLTKYSRAAQYLESIFKMLNDEFFENALTMPVITIQDTPKAYGHVTTSKVWRIEADESKAAYELNIGAGTMNRHIENVCATMMHEMVHIYCIEHGIQDTSRGGIYHNKKFKAEAEKRGLIITYSKKYGFCHTEPSDTLLQFVLDTGLEDIQIGRGNERFFTGISGTAGGATGTEKPIKKKSSTRKYICPSCGVSVRATKQVNIICADCLKLMEVESND